MKRKSHLRFCLTWISTLWVFLPLITEVKAQSDSLMLLDSSRTGIYHPSKRGTHLYFYSTPDSLGVPYKLLSNDFLAYKANGIWYKTEEELASFPKHFHHLALDLVNYYGFESTRLTYGFRFHRRHFNVIVPIDIGAPENIAKSVNAQPYQPIAGAGLAFQFHPFPKSLDVSFGFGYQHVFFEDTTRLSKLRSDPVYLEQYSLIYGKFAMDYFPERFPHLFFRGETLYGIRDLYNEPLTSDWRYFSLRMSIGLVLW